MASHPTDIPNRSNVPAEWKQCFCEQGSHEQHLCASCWKVAATLAGDMATVAHRVKNSTQFLDQNLPFQGGWDST